MRMTHYILLIHCVLLFYSTQSNAQNSINETDLADEIAAHQSMPIAQPFSIQQAIKRSTISGVQLSPNGKNIVYTNKETNGVSLHHYNIETEISKKLFHSKILNRVDWSTDGKILFLQGSDYLAYINPFDNNARAQIFYRFDNQNEESFFSIDSSQDQQLIIRRKITTQNESKPHQLIRIDKQGEETLLYSDKIKVYDFLFDDTAEISFIRQPDKDKHIIYQLNDQLKKPVFSCIVIDRCQMFSFNNRTQDLLMIGFGDFNFRSLFKFNINTKSIQIVHQDPQQLSDVMNVISDDSTGEVIQLDYLSDKLHHYSLNDEWNDHYQWLEANITGNLYITPNKISDYWLIKQSDSQLHHLKYFVYNLKSKNIKPILEESRSVGKPIDSDQLVTNIPITYQASDGMTLFGYVMLPTGRKLSEVPLLTYVHGGPFNRIVGGYNPIQFLVNKGYAIFQPNFRSSTGYGLQYMLAGKEQFSTRVQQDIVDGIDFLLNQGIGDNQKLGVFGHSFGGYSVLSLMASRPNLFVAGVATAPGTDLLELLKKLDQKGINEYDGVPIKAALPIIFADMNNPQVLAKMKSTSPRANWEGIQRPLLIWAGAQDQKIPIVYLRDYALKLKQADKSIEVFEDKKVGHNPSRNDVKTKEAMMYLIADFFNKHIQNTTTESNEDIDNYMKRYRVY